MVTAGVAVMHEEVDMVGTRDAAPKTTALSSSPSMERLGETSILPITILSVNLVTYMDISLVSRDCLHRKPTAVAGQKKRDAAWAEKNKAQMREIKEIDRLNKEIG